MQRLSALRNSVHRQALYAAAPVQVTHTVPQFNQAFAGKIEAGQRLAGDVVLRGRVAAKREASKKLVFYTLESQLEKVQIMCSAKDASEAFEEMHTLTARGDVVSVRGRPGASQSGQLSVMASSVLVEAPCLVNLPLPGSVTTHSEHRRRYRDMLVNGSSVQRLVRRSEIISWMRRYLEGLGFVEVETPILSLRCGGASATPFSTRSDPPLFLRIAPELYLKKLVVGGLDAVFEMGKQFRNEGVDKTHVNEFTTIELYRANWDYEILMTFTETLFRDLVAQFGGPKVRVPFKRMAVIPAINAAAGCAIPEGVDEASLPMLVELCEKHSIRLSGPATVGRCIDKLVQHFVEPQCVDPTFLIDHPRIMSPLAKGHRTKGPKVAERFELLIDGLEYVNAYSELNDPEEQLAALQRQVDEGDPESPKTVDWEYVEALQHGLPTCGGWGMGIDRLVMLLTGTSVIDDVIFFPQGNYGRAAATIEAVHKQKAGFSLEC